MKLPVFHDPVTGEPSLSVTLVAITFTVVLVRWVLGGMTIFRWTLGTISTVEIDAWLTPVFLLYFGRSATKAVEGVAMAKVEKQP